MSGVDCLRPEEAFAFAGLWDSWRTPEGPALETCTILTTTPNRLLVDVHDRMPVILPAASYDLWLDPGFRDVATTTELLKPYDAGLMRRYAVSAWVNNVANDDCQCSEPIISARSGRLCGWLLTSVCHCRNGNCTRLGE